MDRLSAPSHPLRAALSDEMHVRRLPRFASPARLMQIVTLLGEGSAPDAAAHFAAVAGEAGVTLAPGTKYAVVPLGALKLVLERHTEFASYTFVRQGGFDLPFEPDAFGADADAIVAGIPGEVIRATQIAFYPEGTPLPDEERLDTPCRTSGSTPTASGGCCWSIAGCCATSPHNSCCGCRSLATTATWRCSVCRSRSA